MHTCRPLHRGNSWLAQVHRTRGRSKVPCCPPIAARVPPWSVDDPDMKLGQDCYVVRDVAGGGFPVFPHAVYANLAPGIAGGFFVPRKNEPSTA